MRENGSNKGIVIQTIITAGAVIVASVLSAILTSNYNMKTVKLTLTEEMEKTILMNKNALKAVNLSNQNNLLISQQTNENALKMIKLNNKLQSEAATEDMEIKKEKAIKESAIIFVSDISVRVKLLESFVTRLKNAEGDIKKFDLLSPFVRSGGSLEPLKSNLLKDPSEQFLGKLSPLPIECAVVILEFYRAIEVTRNGTSLVEKYFTNVAGDFQNITKQFPKAPPEYNQTMFSLMTGILSVGSKKLNLLAIQCLNKGLISLATIQKKVFYDEKAASANKKKLQKYTQFEKTIRTQVDKEIGIQLKNALAFSRITSKLLKDAMTQKPKLSSPNRKLVEPSVILEEIYKISGVGSLDEEDHFR